MASNFSSIIECKRTVQALRQDLQTSLALVQKSCSMMDEVCGCGRCGGCEEVKKIRLEVKNLSTKWAQADAAEAQVKTELKAVPTGTPRPAVTGPGS